MSALANAQVEMRHMECGECGITFWAPEGFMAERQRTGKGWYCPNGHSRVYRERNEDKLRKQLEESERLRKIAENDAAWQKAVAKNIGIQKTKAQNKLKKFTQRVNAGICPHCNRTFKQLAAHMKTKHADLAPHSEEGCGHEVTQ